MAISKLATYVKLTHNMSAPRQEKIDTIIIHHMAGNLSVETCANVFSGTRQASSNYGIGSDGRIGCYVDEDNRAWTTGGQKNSATTNGFTGAQMDQRAVTIEVANDGGEETNWHVSDKALASLVKLCIDICQRNGIKQLKWKNDPSLVGTSEQNVAIHQWFSYTNCPGPYLLSKIDYVVKEVNKVIAPSATSTTTTKKVCPYKEGDLIRLRQGSTYYDGTPIPQWVFNTAKLYFRGTNSNGYVFSTQATGAVTGTVKPEAMMPDRAATTTTTTTKKATTTVKATTTKKSTTAVSVPFKDGERISLRPGSTYVNGTAIPQWVFNTPLYFRGVNSEGYIFSTQATGAITGVTNKNNVMPYRTTSTTTTKKATTTVKAFSPYTVKVNVAALNIRTGPGTSYAVARTITDQGIYTIVEQQGNWGKLKSGAGWICLDYTTKQ